MLDCKGKPASQPTNPLLCVAVEKPTLDLNAAYTSFSPIFISIVSWKVHGRAFVVHDRKRFLKEVLPE
jgi:hypothetical protein